MNSLQHSLALVGVTVGAFLAVLGAVVTILAFFNTDGLSSDIEGFYGIFSLAAGVGIFSAAKSALDKPKSPPKP